MRLFELEAQQRVSDLQLEAFTTADWFVTSLQAGGALT